MRSDCFKTIFIPHLKIEWFLCLNLFLSLVVVGLSLVLLFSSEPPFPDFEQARKAVARARSVQADVYAADLLSDAEMNLELAYRAWARENRRWMINREFFFAKRYCKEALSSTDRAAQRAVCVRDSLRWLSFTGIQLLKKQINEVRRQLAQLPMQSDLRQRLAIGELLMLESEEAFRRQDYRRAAACCRVAMSKIGNAGDEIESAIHNYLANNRKWRLWVEETLNWSLVNNEVVLIVDKLAHRCYVFESGTKIAEFPVELGPNWLGHKRQQGDGATPEGKYFIRKMKSGKETVYYKALEIDYPNAEDEAMFSLAQHRGLISRDAAIGGGIEIHGDGGKGADWTAGCVALRNQDMDRLFEWVKVGTPVTIVASLRDIPMQPTTAPTGSISAQ